MGIEKSGKRFISILLIWCLFIQTAVMLSGCNAKPEVKSKIKKSENIITLNVYDSQSSYYGLQKGWMAQYLKDRFNVKLNIITGMGLNDKEKSKELKKADIIIFRDYIVTIIEKLLDIRNQDLFLQLQEGLYGKSIMLLISSKD